MADLPVELTVSSSLSASALRAHVAHLASDALEGRGPATKGIERAAEYLEQELRTIGLQPAFGERYRQPFEMTVGVEIGKKNLLAQGKKRYRLGTDYRPFPFSRTGTTSGSLLFVGYGIRAEAQKYDDYFHLDAAGKVLVMFDGEPGEDDPQSPFDGKKTTPASSIRKKVLLARQAKAAAVLLVRELKPAQRRLDPEAEAGLIALELDLKSASALTGLNLAALKQEIDITYQPKSQASGGLPVNISAEIVRERRTVDNVAGLLAPKTPDAEWVVLGAHYDHLGYGNSDSLDDSGKPQIHNGADDNASGTAVVLEAAREMVKLQDNLQRGVMFVLFAGEESGLLGSAHLVRSSPIAMGKVAAMINLDMVGHLRERKLNIMGIKTATEFSGFAERIVSKHGLVGSLGGDGYGPSDHTSFYAEGVPVMFLFTGAHTHYHKPSDDPETLNYLGMAEVGAVATDLLRGLAISEKRPTYVKAEPPKLGDGRGYGPYFGSIPDFGEQEGGVLLAGVREGSPAAKAGVQKGDVIVKFGEYDVRNLQDMTIALREHAPGDEVVVVYVRNGKRIETKAVLAKRQ